MYKLCRVLVFSFAGVLLETGTAFTKFILPVIYERTSFRIHVTIFQAIPYFLRKVDFLRSNKGENVFPQRVELSS
jgi:hypothetical protein